MKKSDKKLTLNKESVRVLGKPELTVAIGGGNPTLENTCTAVHSIICVRCDTDDWTPNDYF